MRRLGLLLGAACAILVVAAVLQGRARTSWRRVAVDGHSMQPTLDDGDWLLVAPAASYRAGEVIVAHDPRSAERLIVKRVIDVAPDGGLGVAGDHPAHSADVIGPVAPADVLGRVRLRYSPINRLGRIR